MTGLVLTHTPPRLWGGPEMGFSIGGWHPFAGGLEGVLELGEINGEPVLSGGLAGVAAHLEAVANGVTLDVLGSSVGGALNSLTDALDAPVIDAATWIDENKTLVISLVAAVGIAILCPYAFAAWQSATSAAEVTAAVDEDLVVDADLVVDTSAPDALGTSLTEGSSLTEGTVATTVAPGATVTVDADVSTGLGTSMTTGTSLTADTTIDPNMALAVNADTNTILGESGAGLQDAETGLQAGVAAQTAAPNALGQAIEKALINTAVGGVTSELLHLVTGAPVAKSQTVPVLTAPQPSIPPWVYWAAAGVGLVLLVRS